MRDRPAHKRVCVGMTVLIMAGMAAGLQADEISLFEPNRILATHRAGSRTLSFPSGQCAGNLYLEPESGLGWNPEGVRPQAEWKYLRAAQGNVRVPGGRNFKLWVQLALTSGESARLHAQNPLMHKMTVADRTREDPHELSGLSQLDPNDLYWLSVSSGMYERAGAEPRIFEPIRRLTGLQMLTLSSAGITDEGLEYLRSLRSLRGLELTQAGITSRGLAVLKDLPALEYLELNSGLTDAGLKRVAQVPNLRWLSIKDGKMWGQGLAELAKLPRLERLCIIQSRGRIFDRHIKYLEGLSQLKGLTLWSSGCDTITDTSLASISKLKNLEELYFIRTMPRFTSAGVAHLKNLKKLKKVNFGQIWVGPAGTYYGDEVAGQLAANHPNLESIRGLSYLSAEGVKKLAKLRNLKSLHVSLKDRMQNYYGPTGLSYLAGLGSLEELLIATGDELADADLASLEPLASLKDLTLFGPSVTDRGMASIAKLRRLESLSLGYVTRGGLNQLNGLSNLQRLSVSSYRKPGVPEMTDDLTLDLSGLNQIKELYLSGLSLQDGDLAFIKHMSLLENLNLSFDPNSSAAGAVFHHFSELGELTRLTVHGLSDCKGEDMAHLNGLPKLRTMYLSGVITDTALASLTGPASLESIYLDTDEPISKQATDDFTKSHPLLEYIHIRELPKFQIQPAGVPKPAPAGQPRVNRQTRQNRRRR